MILTKRIVLPLGLGAPFANALAPADHFADAELAKISLGDIIEIKLGRRSLPQHRLFWAILDHVAKATKFESPRRLLTALKLRTHRYDLEQLPNGEIVPVPHSISFAAMDQQEFQEFFDESIRLICSDVIPGADASSLVDEVQRLLG